MRRNRKVILSMAILILALAVLPGCSKSEDSGKSEDDYEINLGYYDCDHMVAACIGEAAGIYEDMGLNVKVTGNGKVPEAMAAGQMDAGYIGNRGLINANESGSPIVMGANNHIGGSVYLIVSNEIDSPEDLYGKKIAVGSLKKSDAWVAGYSKNLGLSTNDEDFDLINISSDADKYVALSTGQIDGFSA